MTKKARAKVEKNWLEWIVFGVGLALVASTLSYLIYDGATAPDTPPDIEVKVRVEGTRQGAQGFLVPVTVSNRGGRTAEGVLVEVVLEAGAAKEPERAELTLAFLPRGGTREGWVTFRADPRAGALTARALGYEEP
jgi:uncharacterized protein (TIGR02588 family)